MDTAFHPEQLIPLVHAQHPLRRDVIRALQLCNAGQWVSAKVVQLVNEVKESVLREQLVVQTDEDSSMVLDVLADRPDTVYLATLYYPPIYISPAAQRPGIFLPEQGYDAGQYENTFPTIELHRHCF